MDPVRPKLPGTLQAATVLMFVGGALGGLGGLLMLGAGADGLGGLGLFYVGAAVLNVWLAVMIRRGRNWAAVTASVLLAVDSVFLFSAMSTTPSAGFGLAVHILLIVLLWSSSARGYFRRDGQPDRPAESPTGNA